MTRTFATMRTCASLVACAFLYACGGAARDSAGPKAPSTQPATMSEPPATGTSGAGGGTGGVAAPIPGGSDGTGMVVDDVAHAQIQFEDSHKAFSAASGDCTSMCKALSSMQRAADHLCGLTKDGGDGGKKRCDDAQSKVDGAKERVKATCGGCGG
ncbi:MAG: hypothetical protein ABI175_15325 [Polyangiales bacterium]